MIIMFRCIYTHNIAILYLSVLKPGSIIRRVVQQNERNKRMGPFKRRVPQLLNSRLNLINLKMVPNDKENYLFSISLFMFACPFRMLLQSIVYSVFIPFIVFSRHGGMHLRVLLHQSVSEVHTLL